jgi:hypothetical protein
MTGKQKALLAVIGLFTAAGAGGYAYKSQVLDVIDANCGHKIERVGANIKITPKEALALIQEGCKTEGPVNAAGASDTVEIILTKGGTR